MGSDFSAVEIGARYESTRLLLVGEASGEAEAREGLPFRPYAQSGSLLSDALRAVAISRTEIAITNVLRCFPGHVVVEAAGVKKAFRRHYDGELITVHTDWGILPGTPNHPALTQRGWVPLGELMEGDYLVRGSFRERESSSDPDVNGNAPRFDEVFDALANLLIACRVVGRDMDFHGDGSDAEVDVISTNSFLWDGIKTPLSEHIGKGILETAYLMGQRLVRGSSGFGSAFYLFLRQLPSTNGSVGSLSELFTSLWPRLAKANTHGVGFASRGDAAFYQGVIERSIANPGFYTERFQALSKEVSFAKISKIKKSRFTGHVYNLHTDTEKYTANGFIVHNCRPKNDWLEGAPFQYAATSQCVREHLIPAVRELRPRAILALGGTAFRALVQAPKGRYGTLELIRGYALRGSGAAEGIPVIGTFDPKKLRQGMAHLTPLLQRDLRKAFLIAMGKVAPVYDPPANLRYQTCPTIEEAWAYAESVDPNLPLIFDIETPMSTRSDEDERTSFTDRDIKLFQCTQRRGTGIALPFRDEYIEVIRTILRNSSTRVGFNDWNFDDPVLEANGIEVGDTVDAMVLFGHAQPDLPKNLQAAAQWCGFQWPWKHLNDSDLEFYGCADVDATLCVYQTLRAQLEREGRWESYRRYFAEVWPILRDMSRRGVPIDEQRRQELKDLIAREDERVTAAVQALVPAEVLSTKQKSGLKRTPKSTEGMVEIEVVIEKEEKCQCTKKTRASCTICAGSGIVPAGVVIKRWAEPTAFNPNSSHQVKKFMKFMKHPIPKHSKRTDANGEASETTEVKELERLYAKTKHLIYPLLIEKRQLTKVLGTYVEGWAPGKDGRVHTTFTFQTATWQTSSRAPNTQNGLKHGKSAFQKKLAKAFNGMQRAEPGFAIVNFDFKSFHALTTAHDFNIPDYARLARIDIHSFVACQFLRLPECKGLWEREDEDMKGLFKFLRQQESFNAVRDVPAKQTILGIQFGRGPASVYAMYREFFDSLSQAKAIHELVYSLFPRLKIGQNEICQQAADEQRLLSKWKAIRWFHDVIRWDRKQQKWVRGEQAEQAMAFYPANHAFGHLRDTLLRCEAKGYPEKYGFYNQIHDSIVAHCPLELVEECKANVLEEMRRPSEVLIYPNMAPNGFHVDAEATVGESLAELK